MALAKNDLIYQSIGMFIFSEVWIENNRI
jgi:hypothetical protein